MFCNGCTDGVKKSSFQKDQVQWQFSEPAKLNGIFMLLTVSKSVTSKKERKSIRYFLRVRFINATIELM